jgi:hypothetical protein
MLKQLMMEDGIHLDISIIISMLHAITEFGVYVIEYFKQIIHNQDSQLDMYQVGRRMPRNKKLDLTNIKIK